MELAKKPPWLTAKFKGMLGALAVQSDGNEFSVGTGFSDAERLNPPPVGSTITFRIFRVVHDPFPP